MPSKRTNDRPLQKKTRDSHKKLKIAQHLSFQQVAVSGSAKGIELTTASCKIVHMELLALQVRKFMEPKGPKKPHQIEEKAGGDGFLLLRTPSAYNKKLINIKLYVWGLYIVGFL